MATAEFYTEKIFDRAHRTGEEIKNDLPNLIARAVESEVWRERINPTTGQPFETVGEWLVANYPLGPAVGSGRFALTYDEMIELAKEHQNVRTLLVKHRPKRGRGGDRRSNDFKATNGGFEKPPRSRSQNSRASIEARLAEEHPEIWQQYIAGEFPSARQAGIKAGFIKDTHDPLMRLKANWRKATKKQRREFLKWVDEQQ